MWGRSWNRSRLGNPALVAAGLKKPAGNGLEHDWGSEGSGMIGSLVDDQVYRRVAQSIRDLLRQSKPLTGTRRTGSLLTQNRRASG